MKLIYRLEKSKAFWYLLIILPLFFLLRLPSVIEPHWYGDEGIYQVLGNAINNGRILYSEAWDNKPPLLYITYAIFQSDQFMVRFSSLIGGVIATFALFFLAQKLFKNLGASIITTILFTLLFATPYIEGNIANAENFMLLPIILAGFLIYSLLQKQTTEKLSSNFFTALLPKALQKGHFSLLIAGMLLGVAFLFKIVALFDFAAFFLFLIITSLPEKISLPLLKKQLALGIKNQSSWLFALIRNSLFIILGFITPLFLTILWFASQGALLDFIQATFFGNIGYVGWGNNLIIPQGFLILKLLLLVTTVLILFIKRNHISKATIFILLWIAFALFSAFFSQRPYTHYVLVILPSFCLLIGLFFATKTKKLQLSLLCLIVSVMTIVVTNFNFYPLRKTVLYYQNAFQFITGEKDVASYQSFFDHKTPRDYEIASFIKRHTTSSDSIFVWGDSPQIYALADKLPPGKYTVAYHITQNKDALEEVQKQIDITHPKYIIVLAEAPELPFRLAFYNNPYIISNTLIYEKNY